MAELSAQNVDLSTNEIVQQAIIDKDVWYLCHFFFNEDITPLQEKLIRKVAFGDFERLCVCATTRWGKSYCVSRGIALFIMMRPNKKIIFLAPASEQATILRTYMTDLVLKCPNLRKMADLDRIGVEKIKKQASRSRQTFKNGCEYRVFSCHGEGINLMGFGLGSEGGIIVKDESVKIKDIVNAKIMRMMGDNPEKSKIIELFNPWDRDNKSFEHWEDPEWENFFVGWREAVKDYNSKGVTRPTVKHVERMRKEMTPMEFEVLYESKFPKQSEDSIFDLDKVNEGISNNKKLEYDIKVISCDVADKGRDWTVIYWGYMKEGEVLRTKSYGKEVTKEIMPSLKVINHYSEPMSENTDVAGRINNKIMEFIGMEDSGIVNIDVIGLGTGVVSMVKLFCRMNGYGNVVVTGCPNNGKANDSKRFSNAKAENYFRLRKLFKERKLQIPYIKKLNKELGLMKWGFTSKGRIYIIDPQKSPDFADALMYFVWNARAKRKLDWTVG